MSICRKNEKAASRYVEILHYALLIINLTKMRYLLTFSIFATIATFVMSCNSKSTMPGAGELDSDSVEVLTVADTAIYGTVDESTTMHMLTINMDDGKQQTFAMNLDSLGSDIQGGIFAGDKVTLTVTKGEEEMQVVKCVNLSTLLGKWTSLDRNFQIEENGVVKSNLAAESNPYTQWQMVNARIILNADTFDILTLGADSMELENSKGIFIYKRQR